MTKLFRDRGATGQPQQDWPWRGFRVFGEPAPRQSAPLLTQGTLIDRSVTVEVDSRPISSGVVGPGCVPLTGGWPVQVFNADPFGAYLQLAQNIGQLCAFTVFDRSDALVSTNADPVASAGPGMSVNYTNTRSGAKLVLAADPGVLSITDPSTPLSWDFINQRAIEYSAALGQLPVRSIVQRVAAAWVVGCTAHGPHWETGAAVIVLL